MYIKEFDVLVNAYCPSGLHSYATYITTIEGKSFEVIHKLLGKEKFCDKIIHQPVKLNFLNISKECIKIQTTEQLMIETNISLWSLKNLLH